MKKGCMFLWKKNLYVIEGYFSELEWIYNVKIIYENFCVIVYGNDSIDVLNCLSVIDNIYRKRGVL